MAACCILKRHVPEVIPLKKLLLVLNPCAGQRKANRVLPEIIRIFLDAGYRCETFVTAAAGDATCFVTDHAAEYDRIVCIGGDGTLNETIAGMLHAGADLPIGYIPAGTTNDYANSLRLSADVLQAARDAVEGDIIPLDVGTFNGRYFTELQISNENTDYTVNLFASEAGDLFVKWTEVFTVLTPEAAAE